MENSRPPVRVQGATLTASTLPAFWTPQKTTAPGIDFRDTFISGDDTRSLSKFRTLQHQIHHQLGQWTDMGLFVHIGKQVV